MYALAGLSPEAAARLQDALPRCYSMEFDRDCIKEANPAGHRGCQAVLDAYAEDYDAAEAAVDALPYCSEHGDPLVKLAFAAGGLVCGMVLGVLVG